ncbi:MAG: hypothetical protein ACH34X_11235 [Thiolinea sp.]
MSEKTDKEIAADILIAAMQPQDGSPIWRLSNESLTKEAAIEFICSSFLALLATVREQDKDK